MSTDAIIAVALGVLGIFLLYVVVAPKRRMETPASSEAGGKRPAPAEPTAPPDIKELLRKADALINEGELDRANLVLAQATALEPQRPGALYVQSRLVHAQGEPERAIKMLERACEGRPDVPVWHGLRGEWLLELQRPDLAVQAFEQLLELDPASAPGQEGLERARGLL